MLVCAGCKCRTSCEGEGQSWVVTGAVLCGRGPWALALGTSQDELRCSCARLPNEWGSPYINRRGCQVYHMFARLFHHC